MIDPMLPDDESSKVNACVDKVYQIWENNADTKTTQPVFCELSTPESDGTFNAYDDMRQHSSSVAFRQSKSAISTKPRPMLRRKNCLVKFVVVRCVFSLAQLRR